MSHDTWMRDQIRDNCRRKIPGEKEQHRRTIFWWWAGMSLFLCLVYFCLAYLWRVGILAGGVE